MVLIDFLDSGICGFAIMEESSQVLEMMEDILLRKYADLMSHLITSCPNIDVILVFR